jgi:hypothetical protein
MVRRELSSKGAAFCIVLSECLQKGGTRNLNLLGDSVRCLCFVESQVPHQEEVVCFLSSATILDIHSVLSDCV